MTDGTSVQRDRLTIGNQATTNVTITEVDRARALPRLTGLSGYTGASFPGPNASDVPAALLSAFLSSDTELRIEGSTEGNEASNDISWEVIEWAAAAATRRVMVIS